MTLFALATFAALLGCALVSLLHILDVMDENRPR